VLTVPDADRAFYSKGTYDIEYEFPFGVQELEGVAYRTNYDLMSHQTGSGKPLEYFDEETKAKFVPHVVEPSAGVDRTLLALICEAFAEETVTDEKGKSETRTVMRFHPRMAPIKVGVFPLLKNKPELVAKAREVHALLKPHMMTFYDEAGAIGRRYRRQDEAGTPFGLTIDFETLGERGDELRDTVTLRHRDSMKQERVAIHDLLRILLPQVM
jgi:glycyl-tRNA synthetase